MKRAVFVDAGYLERLGLDLDRMKFDRLGSLVDHILDGDREGLTKVFVYLPGYCMNYVTFDEQVREECLMDRIELRFGVSASRADVMLAVDAMIYASRGVVDEVVLVAGDSEFTCLVQAIKNMGISTVLWHGPRGFAEQSFVSEDLFGVSDVRRELDMAVIARLESAA